MKQRPPGPTPSISGDREARLAEALRANLHRRKAQARALAPSRADDKNSDQ